MLTGVAPQPGTTFNVPPDSIATNPPEFRGVPRDGIRMMAATPSGMSHHVFSDLADLLDPGDLLVVNNSGTLKAAIDLDDDTMIHFSTRLPGGLTVVEPRRREGDRSLPGSGTRGENLALPGGAYLELLAPYATDSVRQRLWVARLEANTDLTGLLRRFGRPIQYAGLDRRIAIENYQTAFARIPGSSEMPSAGRPFSPNLVAEMVGKGIGFSTITLHTGVSSLEVGEKPYAEWFDVPEATAASVNAAHARDGRVVAVGTTVVRALATTTEVSGVTHPGRGWTEVVVTPHTKIPSVTGLITGWHEPRSSHLDILRALAPEEILEESYREALAEGYLWHEFGDSHLLLP